MAPKKAGNRRAAAGSIAVTILVIAIAVYTVGSLNARQSDIEDHRPHVPDLALQTVDGDTLTLGQLRGKPVLIPLMATWCGYCRDEVAEIKVVRAELGNDSFHVLSVDIDERETVDEVRAWRDEVNVDWFFVLDSTNDVEGVFLPESLPTSILLDKNGRVAWRSSALVPAEELAGIISSEL